MEKTETRLTNAKVTWRIVSLSHAACLVVGSRLSGRFHRGNQHRQHRAARFLLARLVRQQSRHGPPSKLHLGVVLVKRQWYVGVHTQGIANGAEAIKTDERKPKYTSA